MNYDWDFTEVWQYSSIGSDNGLVPVRRQAIIWTNGSSLLTHICVSRLQWLYVEMPRYNSSQKTGDVSNYSFLNENYHILIYISMRFVTNGHADYMHIFDEIHVMALHRTCGKLLSELVDLLTHIYVTRHCVNKHTCRVDTKAASI